MGIGTTRDRRGRPAFTLIELLVVVAIIALLISILLPSLQAARRQARSVTCATNLGHIGTAVATYLAANRDVYPPSYVYPRDAQGSWDTSPDGQSPTKDFGYLHWSYFLYGGSQADVKAFQCPEFQKGGLPRTFPGSDPANWMGPDQRDDRGNPPPSSTGQNRIEDKQAPFMAYSGNALVMPRNKFNRLMAPGGAVRFNRMVPNSMLVGGGSIILAAEFQNNWRAIATRGGSGDTYLSKSHRPTRVVSNPNYGLGDNDVYGIPVRNNSFTYLISPNDQNMGLLPYDDWRKREVICGDSNIAPANYIGRHHPGGDDFGGTANFLYIGGAVERKPVLQTLKGREWGHKFYSLTGSNDVRWEHEF